jgi:hypothetical protein
MEHGTERKRKPQTIAHFGKMKMEDQDRISSQDGFPAFS